MEIGYIGARLSVAMGLAALAIGATADAALVASNARTGPVGAYSDAYSSGGYTYAQSGAQSFSVEDETQVDSLRFWGSVNGFFGQGIDNITSFEVRIWNADFTAVVYQATVSASRVATGVENFFNQPEYQFDATLNTVLAAGSYNLNVGAVLAVANGDQFVWSSGLNDLGFYFTNGTPFGSWTQYSPGVNNTAGGAFEMFGETVPAPGAIALFLSAAALVTGGRRRR
jgi:hypothetical protein